MTPPRGFRLVPDDLLFLRDGRPSTIGSDHYLASIFPPSPATLYGALRTKRLVERVSLAGLDENTWRDRLGEELGGELGPWGGFGSMCLRGPWLTHGAEIMFPAPADLGVVTRVGTDASPEAREVVRFRLEPPARGAAWSHPLGLWRPYRRASGAWQDASSQTPAPAAGEWWLTARGLSTWAEGGVPDATELVHRRSLWIDEPRTGVGLQTGETARRQAEEHRLYTFGFVRLQRDVAIGFDLTGAHLEPQGGIRLGGEGKTAELTEGPALPAPPPSLPRAGRFVLSFLTPSLSTAGGYPPGFAADRLASRLGASELTLVAGMVRGATTLGGWDLARRRPKPLRRALPAGSTFLFDDRAGGAAGALWGTNASDFADEHLARQGFGLAVTAQYLD